MGFCLQEGRCHLLGSPAGWRLALNVSHDEQAMASTPLGTASILSRTAGGTRPCRRMLQTCAVVATPPPRVMEVPNDANALLTPYKLGEFELAHRMVLAPLTRCRAIGTGAACTRLHACLAADCRYGHDQCFGCNRHHPPAQRGSILRTADNQGRPAHQ